MEAPQREAVDAHRSAAPRQPEGDPAAGSFAGKWLFWVPMPPLIALDLWSKAWAFQLVKDHSRGHFSPHNTVDVFDFSWVEFELVTWLNQGTIWGLGAQFHFYLKFLRVGAIGLILYFAYKTPARQRWMLLALCLILSGAVGNLYDNFFHFDAAYSTSPKFAGAVRDFLHFHNGESWNFPAFNVADSCISVGAGLLFILLWTMKPAAVAAAEGTVDEVGARDEDDA